MKYPKEKTTILFVDNHQQSLRPVRVSSKFIRHWKKYAAAVLVLIFALAGTVSWLIIDKADQTTIQANLHKKLQSIHKKIAEMDTSAVREKFSQIDGELKLINKFLKARGIQATISEPVGGEVEANDDMSTVEITEFYKDYIRRIGYTLENTPIGYPYKGKITSTFGHRENPFNGPGIEAHKGMDIKGPMGAPVKSTAKGKVIFAGLKGGYGKCIIIDHANGIQTLYGHLSVINVKSGDKVNIAQHIGNIGSTGRSTGPHLHYEVHKQGRKINPQSFLSIY